MENLIKMDDFGRFSHIFGNTHIVFQSSIFREGINPSSWVSILVPGYQSYFLGINPSSFDDL